MTPRERWYRVSSHPPKWPDRVCKEFVGGFDTVSLLDQEPYQYLYHPRTMDGVQGAKFLAEIKERLEKNRTHSGS